MLAQNPFDKPQYKQILERWMAGTGPAHLFVYYQKPYKVNEQGEIEELRQAVDWFVTDGKSPCPDFRTSGGNSLNLNLERNSNQI